MIKAVVLGSGSEGNSTYIETNSHKILIDVGFTYKKLKEKLNAINVCPEEIDYLFITHEHSDHIKGLNIFLRKVSPFLCIKEKIKNVLLQDLDYDKIICLDNELIIDDLYIKILRTSHDALDPIGFMFTTREESLVYMTDTGYINLKILNEMKNKDFYIIESNHDPELLINGPYPDYLQKRVLSDRGHLSNELCGAYLSKIIGPKTKQVILAHLSKTNNKEEIALNTVKRILKENGIIFDNIICANQEKMVEIQ